MRVLVGVLAGVVLLVGGWLWLRDSSLVSVERVHISGVHGVDALEIRQALDAAAKRMTTMDFDVGTLRAAVAPFVVVEGVSATTSFPHTVSIRVSERLPVAALSSAGQRTAVAADGTVLGPALLSSSLPAVSGASEPTPGARVTEGGVLAALEVLGATPAPLTRFVARVFEGREGLTVAMRNGLLIYFGNAARPHAKWLSFARVLAAPSSAGAWYVDVRVPERPAAGISNASASTPVQGSSSDPTAAALAASLVAVVGGSSGSSTSTSTASGSSGTEPSAGATQPVASTPQPTARAPEQNASAPEQNAGAGEATPGGSTERSSAGASEAPTSSVTGG